MKNFSQINFPLLPKGRRRLFVSFCSFGSPTSGSGLRRQVPRQMDMPMSTLFSFDIAYTLSQGDHVFLFNREPFFYGNLKRIDN